MTTRTCYVCANSPDAATVPATYDGCEHLASNVAPSQRRLWGLCEACHAAGPCPECQEAPVLTQDRANEIVSELFAAAGWSLHATPAITNGGDLSDGVHWEPARRASEATLREQCEEWIATQTEYERCAYCDARVRVECPDVPALDDDAAWAHHARMHDPDCEWISTRAHRVDRMRY